MSKEKETSQPEGASEDVKKDGPASGLVRLYRTDSSPEGGFIDLTKKESDKLLAIEKRMGVKNYELRD